MLMYIMEYICVSQKHLVMDYYTCVFCVVLLSLVVCSHHVNVDDEGVNDDVPFWQNYGFPWGSSHTQLVDQNKQLQLSLDQYTGTLIYLFNFISFVILIIFNSILGLIN